MTSVTTVQKTLLIFYSSYLTEMAKILRIWMGKKIVNISMILKKNLTSRKKSTNNTETEKLLIEEKCLECSICNSTFGWQNGLRAHVKSMLNEKFHCEQCQWSFRSFEKLKEHIDYLHKKTLTSLKYYKNISVINVIRVV